MMKEARIISIFNNKGGVGKSTLAYHLGHALNELEKKTLMIDLDPQCNLTINGIDTERLHSIWEGEDKFIGDFEQFNNLKAEKKQNVLSETRSVHFLLKPTEDGLSDFEPIPPPIRLGDHLGLIPGRLSIHKYENKLAERWSGAYQSDNLAIRTITKIRDICKSYSEKDGYEFVIIDTSPSLGILNKTIISTVDGFFIPAQPDMFSLYGIRNIGNSLDLWKKEFDTIYGLISEDKRNKFPRYFVQFLGYTIYNAKKYTKQKNNNDYSLAQAHYSYVQQIPNTISNYIKEDNRKKLSEDEIKDPIGGRSIMHTHNTFPSVAQSLNCPMWEVPETYQRRRDNAQEVEVQFNPGSSGQYKETKNKYIDFANSLLQRINKI